MLTFYVQTGCPYCRKVLDTADGLGLRYEKRNVADLGVEEELVARGGSAQVPFMIDEEHGVEMYESEHIAAYLHKAFGKEPVS